MAEQNVAEYEQLIKNLSDRFGKQKKTAHAKGTGEAIRRGLVNPTGTSDMEMALRQSRVQPIQEAESNTIANLVKQMADKGREERMIGEGRAYGTSEREASQAFGAGQAEKDALRSAIMEGYVKPGSTNFGDAGAWSGYTQSLGTPGEGKGSTWFGRAGQAERGRSHDYGMAAYMNDLNKPRSKDKTKWWQPIAGAVGGAAGQAVGTRIGNWGGKSS